MSAAHKSCDAGRLIPERRAFRWALRRRPGSSDDPTLMAWRKGKSTMNPRYDFKGQVALVTGASSGMGLATARAFAEAGAAVVLADINEEGLGAATDALTSAGHQAIGIPLRCIERGSGRRDDRPRAARHGLQQRRHSGPAERRSGRAGRELRSYECDQSPGRLDLHEA